MIREKLILCLAENSLPIKWRFIPHFIDYQLKV
jgi:hypothetical protein